MLPLKRRYFILIATITLILGFWSARLQLVEFLVSSSMNRAGLEDITADIERLGLNQTHLSRFGFKMQTENGELSLDVRDISINYKPEELANRHIDSIVIDVLQLYYESTGKPQDDTVHTQPLLKPRMLISMLRNTLRESIFFNNLSIQSFTLNGEPFAKFDGKTLRVTSSSDNGEVQAKLSVIELPQIVVARLSENGFGAELKLADILAAKLVLEINDTDINGEYQVSPSDLQLWLQAFVSMTGFEEIGAINGSLSLNFDNDDQIHAGFTGITDSLALEPYSANKLELGIGFVYSPVVAGSGSSAQVSHQFKLKDNSFISVAHINAGVALFSDARIGITGTFETSQNNWRYEGALNSNMITATYNTQQISFADLELHIIADAEIIKSDGGFSLATLPGHFDFDLAHNLDTGTGELSLVSSSPIDLSAEGRQLSQLLAPWNFPFDLLSGNIQLATDASWSKDDAFRLNAEISFADIGGNIGEIVFSGLSFDHELVILPELSSLQHSEIKVNTVDSGVTLSNISTRFAVEPAKTGPLPRVVLLDLEGEILGGEISADGLVYDLNRSKNNLLIKASDIDLAEIVKTQQLEGITASGRLDGTLPIEINDAGIVIEQGSFNNSFRKGTIRYRPEAGTDQIKQNRLAGMALDALRDFQYTHLQAGVNYTPEGMLGVSLELKGISPEVDAKRPVHLNINTEQNLISLLKSLRFAQGVSESIDNRVRRQYENNHNN